MRDAAGGDGPTRALVGLFAVVVLLSLVVGWLWWLDHRSGQVALARQQALHSAREQMVTVLPNSTVLASAVVRADPEQVVVLLFVNQTTHTSPSETVQLSGHRIELTMTRVDDRWRVSDRKRV
ncbi:MAG: hypothetical protein ACRDRM_04355 [Pseudonocardiaceae bacterium]